MNTSIFTQRMDWHGITIEVSWEPAWLSRPEDAYNVGHLQITSVAPERAPLPLTETGYRSLFINPEHVTAEGGPLGFLRAWLDCEAQSPRWRAHEQASRQLALF
ncbi:MAG: hypothetical protein AB7O44_28965 [Hyphomicrobiaceae bacterium]